ncbi:helix-turn-helix domain-containing protein [Actinocorallia longicatena]|uniref:TetR/AcrR family transcriptional regulator n=1 Tax=Actinocorallia longicatena TaxID=111803 RepID=A0ABP6Q4D7_9ACTN
MTARPRERKDGDERREQILACARELFRERSYADVSSVEIAAAAGVSRGLLNHYFGTKRDLYRAAVEEMLKIPPIPVPAFVAGASVRDRIAESLDGWLELLERNAETWLAALDRSAPGGDAELNRLLEEARERAVERITEVVGLTRTAEEHPQVKAVLRAFAAMAETASREWLERGRLTREEVGLTLESGLTHLLEVVVPALTSGRAPRSAP